MRILFSYGTENRQLKTDLFHLRNELAAYQVKCVQLETEIKQIEYEKDVALEEIAKSWGHHNEKQKIKYTGRIIKDIDSITQVINKKNTFIKCPNYYTIVEFLNLKKSIF